MPVWIYIPGLQQKSFLFFLQLGHVCVQYTKSLTIDVYGYACNAGCPALELLEE